MHPVELVPVMGSAPASAGEAGGGGLWSAWSYLLGDEWASYGLLAVGFQPAELAAKVVSHRTDRE